MTDPQDPGREAAEVKAKEGFGAVPNVPPVPEGEEGQVKEALHEVEEQKGDWSKGH